MIKKVIGFCVLSVLTTVCMYAGDWIVYKDGKNVEVLVLDITPSVVKYKELNTPDGEVKTVPKSVISAVYYANGAVDLFTDKGNEVVSSGGFSSYDEISMYNLYNMSYKDKKKRYPLKSYVRDPMDSYNPKISGLLSFLIPGVGQMYAGESKRGLEMLLFDAVLSVGYLVILNFDIYEKNNSFYDDGDDNPVQGWPYVLGGAILAFDIYTIIDAVKVAKVNNMYERELRKRNNLSFNLHPFYNQYSHGIKVNQVGLGLCLGF